MIPYPRAPMPLCSHSQVRVAPCSDPRQLHLYCKGAPETVRRLCRPGTGELAFCTQHNSHSSPTRPPLMRCVQCTCTIHPPPPPHMYCTYSSWRFPGGAGQAGSARLPRAGSGTPSPAHGMAQGRAGAKVSYHVTPSPPLLTLPCLCCRDVVECDLTFVGLVVMQNRLKKETTPVISTLTEASIRTLMITGLTVCCHMITTYNVH